MSRRRHQPTEEQRRQVMTMAGFGIPQPEIARLINISDRTLRTYYRRELDTGATEANVRVAQSLYTMAVKDRVPSAAIFWLKSRAGWKEAPQDLNIGGTDKPMMVDFRWSDALPAAASTAAKLEPPTIEPAPADDAEGVAFRWASD